MTYNLINGNCLEIMQSIPRGSIDAIITDLPYGTTKCKWDTIIPFEEMWGGVRRVLKPNGVFITTSSQPFTSLLIMSNPKYFRDEWIWNKSNPSNIAAYVNHPMKYHESVLVFGSLKTTFNRQMIERMESGKNIIESYKKNNISFKHGKSEHFSTNKTVEYSAKRYDANLKNPSSVIYFKSERCHPRLHSTQKPVPLYEYFIKTYTNENETILDITMGSGTTIEAAERIGRNSIGIELNKDIFKIAKNRIENLKIDET